MWCYFKCVLIGKLLKMFDEGQLYLMKFKVLVMFLFDVFLLVVYGIEQIIMVLVIFLMVVIWYFLLIVGIVLVLLLVIILFYW